MNNYFLFIDEDGFTISPDLNFFVLSSGTNMQMVMSTYSSSGVSVSRMHEMVYILRENLEQIQERLYSDNTRIDVSSEGISCYRSAEMTHLKGKIMIVSKENTIVPLSLVDPKRECFLDCSMRSVHRTLSSLLSYDSDF